MRKKFSFVCVTMLAALLLGIEFLMSACAVAQPSTRLSENGKPLQPIVVSAEASERVKASAATLAEYLNRISGATFETQNGDGKSGIVIGVAKDFPALGLAAEFDSSDPMRREEYLLRSTPTGVLLVGATDLAVQGAVWDFLYRLGYRQFFPGATWEVIPKNANLQIAVNDKEKPDYYSRRIWFTYGTWPENGKRMGEWSVRNRALNGLALNTGHAYAGIISRNKAEFAAHPEYTTPINGERRAPQTPREMQSVKFDISNPGLRRLVINDALRFFEQNPDADSYSVDPNDGGGWTNTPEELAIGSVSNRVTLLANEVAEAVNKKYPGKLIGFYAYNMHSPPPTIRVHPNVVVSVATAFISGGFTVDQLIDGWQKQGATIGMREYYSIIHWDKDMPRNGRAANINYLTDTLTKFHSKGARFMSAESSDNWGPHGLGYYIASRVMWDVDEAKNVPALIEDFFDKSFGPAKEPIREYYGLINTGAAPSKPRPMSEDVIGRMYRALQAAYAKTEDAAIRARIDDLALYTRYVELYVNYTSTKGEERQANYEKLIRHAYQIRNTHMLHSLAIYRTGLRDKSVKIPPEASWQTAEKDRKTGAPLNPWKQDPMPSTQEIQQLVGSGVANNKLLDFEATSYSDNLVPATALNLAPVPRAEFVRWRGAQEYFVWAGAPGEIKFWGTAGTIYNSRGSARAQVFDAGEDSHVEADAEDDEEAALIAPKPLAAFDLPPDQQEHEYSFSVPKAGLYRVRVTDRMMGTSVRFAPGVPVSVRSALGATPGFGARWRLYFYVPKNTKSVGGFAYGGGRVLGADGKAIFNYPAKDGYFNIAVPTGQDGKLWAFEAANGHIGLMTIPPFLANSEKELLLPKEVVEADAR